MNIYEVLEYGAIVYGDEDQCMIITFNGHATFNVWRGVGGIWDGVDCFTRYETTLNDAPKVARNWAESRFG